MCDKRKTFYFYQKFEMEYDYFKMPNILFNHPYIIDKLATESKLLYSFLLNRVFLSIRNKKMDQHGRIYIIYPIGEIMKTLRISKPTAIKRMKELEEYGLVERKRRGRTLPDLIYVKNIFLIMGEEGEEEKYEKEMREAEADSIEEDFVCEVRSTSFTSRGKRTLPLISINTKVNNYVSKKEAPKATAVKKQRRKSYNEIIDAFTPDENLRAALKKYIQQRLMKKAVITNDGLELLLKRLSTLACDVSEQQQIVENAIIGSFSNFYPVRIDYSDANNRQQSKKPGFNDFSCQRNYDYDLLEKVLTAATPDEIAFAASISDEELCGIRN